MGPNLININYIQLNKLTVLSNKCTHNILGYSSYKVNTTTFLKKLDWLSFPQTIVFQSLKLIHKVSFEQEPIALNNYLNHNLERSDISRLVRKPRVKRLYKTAKTKNTFLHRSIFIYNNPPDTFRFESKKKFA